MPDKDNLDCDVAVIGAGTAGLAAARRALREGARVLLIDEAFNGTMCANVGCMPSKLLIAAARTARQAHGADVFGIKIDNIAVDGAAVMTRLRDERDRFARLTRQGFEDFPSGTMVKSRAKFVSPNTLELEDGRTIKAKAIVIATGGKPTIPDGFADLGDLCLTHETVFELTDLPKSLAVVGAGPIGLELAQAFARLGVKTCLFDESKGVGSVEDDAIQKAIQTAISAEMDIHLGVKTTGTQHGSGVKVTWTGATGGSDIFDRVLIAAGRPPRLKNLELENAGIACDDHGTPLYDRQTMQCGESAIFMAGDADAQSPVLHEASAEGQIAGRNAATFPAVTRTQRMVPFSMIFSDPVIAKLGEAPGPDTLTGKASYTDQGRARIENEALGEVRIYAEPISGRLTGALLFCPGAEHMAHLLVQAVSQGMTASQMLAQPFYHPTLEEGLKPALRDICKSVPSSGDYDRTIVSGA